MAQYNFTYADGTVFTIDIDLPTRDISISRIKAGNVRKWIMKELGPNLVRDEVMVSVFEQNIDSEGDALNTTNDGKSAVIYDKDYFTDLISYTNQGGIIGQANICIDTLLKKRLAQTRVFDIDGNFIIPVYFELSGVSPDNDPDFNNGSITATILQDGGYVDLEVRFRIASGAWQPWESISGPVTKPGLTSETYEAQVRSLGTSLMIEPIESVTI